MRHLAFLLPLALLAGCATAGDARVLVAGTEATLSVGETVALPDASRLTYVGVTSDSRISAGFLISINDLSRQSSKAWIRAKADPSPSMITHPLRRR